MRLGDAVVMRLGMMQWSDNDDDKPFRVALYTGI